MTSAILLNRKKLIGGMPEFTYSGDYELVDDGSESGYWQYAFTSSGIFLLKKNIFKATIQIQGAGGGGGASDGVTDGNDGHDGQIVSLIQKLAADEYVLTIGVGGERGYDSAGRKGGDTAFGDLITAIGGDGGEYAGDINQEHGSIYVDYGKGGLGGTTTQHDGALITLYYTTINTSGYAYIRKGPNEYSGSNGVVYSGEVFYLEDNTKHPDTNPSQSTTWYKLADGRGYIPTDRCRPLSTEISDTRAWYGLSGNGGIILLSGEA